MKLEVGSTIYSGFIEAQVRSSMDTLFDEFRFVASNRWGDDKGIKLGDDCRILSPDDEQLLDGFVFGLQIPIGGDVVVTGFDRTADLIASTVSGTGEFKNLSVKDAISQICSPFGISVSGDAGATIEIYRYNLNEKAIDVVRDIISRHGLLANSDGSGNIILEKATTNARAELQLVEGNNINKGSVVLSENRYSDLSMIGQDRSSNSSSSGSGFSDRHRPNIIIHGGDLTQGQATTGASWTSNMARPESYSVTVSGLYNERPNRLIDIESQTLGVSGSLLIRSVLWGLTNNGHETTFDLVNPALYGGEDTENGWVR